MSGKPGYYEFFAGGGMARAGLGPGWRCLFANDKKKKEQKRKGGIKENNKKKAQVKGLLAKEIN
jgi:hypothetical protein